MLYQPSDEWILPAVRWAQGHEPRGLTDAQSAALASLQKIDDYPLYTMDYSGPYTVRAYRPEPASLTALSSQSAPQACTSAWRCSLFAALGNEENRLLGRNFDWQFSPALLLFTDPPNGFASVSMVNLTFLGISPAAVKSLTDLPVGERTALLSAPSMPFDGMNEYGLAVAMAAVPDAYQDAASYDPLKPSIGSIGIIREILDHARNIDEAAALFDQYNITFRGGPPIHYLIADARGKAVLVEFYQGKMLILPNEAPWHLATNHLRCIAQGDGGCQRYHILSERLAAASGQLDAKTALQLLAEVAQGSTQWSVAYNMTSGDVSVVIGQSYNTVFPFHLNILSAK